MDFNDIDSFYKKLISDSEKYMNDVVLPKIKEKARELIQEEWYGRYDPNMYIRDYSLLDAFEIKCEVNGSEIIGTLYIKDQNHIYNETWVGKSYALEEIITDYMVRDHMYLNRIPRKGFDVMSATEEYAFGQGLTLLLNKLKKSYNIS